MVEFRPLSQIYRLNRRLEALSMTKYGSVDSGLNRVGIAAPGTNKHAIEGSNPIWNETLKAPDFDAVRYICLRFLLGILIRRRHYVLIQIL